MPGFLLSSSALWKLALAASLVFGDDRGWSIPIELVAEASLDLVFLEPAAAIEKDAIRQIGEGPVPDSAEIGKAVFDKHPPIRGDGILRAAARRPANPSPRETVGCEERRDGNTSWGHKSSRSDVEISGKAAKGNTARAVNHESIPGDAELA